MGFGVINTHQELHRLSDRVAFEDDTAETARRLAGLIPGSIPVEILQGKGWELLKRLPEE